MRFLNIELLAYGPFTNTSLDLSAGKEGLHLIYGSNEAGKSAALRSITDLLYGIPSRTTDNFIHDNTKIRISAVICHSDGEQLHIMRRKGSKNTLLDSSGEPLPFSVLNKYLSEVSRELFITMFGINQTVLVEGGKSLVAGGGDIGQSLFAAGLGITGMRETVESLEAEAGDLFRPRGKKLINNLINQFKDLKKQCIDKSLSSKDWIIHDQGLSTAEEEMKLIEKELHGLKSAHARLERLKKAVPKIVSLKKTRAELEEMGEVVSLPPEFPSQRQKNHETLTRAESNMERLQKNLNEIEKEIATISPAQFLIQARDNIDDLYRRSGSHKKAMSDLPKRKADYNRLLDEAGTILKKLGSGLTLEKIDSLRLTDSQITRIRKLGREQEPLLERRKNAGRAEFDLSRELRAVREDLALVPMEKDAAKLKEALRNTGKQGDLSSLLQKAEAELKIRQNQVALHLKRLGLWKDSLNELEQIAVPSGETVNRFEKNFIESNNLLQRVEQSISELNERLAGLEHQIETLKAAGSVPTVEELQRARSHRGDGWRLVKNAWLFDKIDTDMISAFDPDAANLAEGYEKSVRMADEISDRLRNESDRVAKLAGFVADQQSSEKGLAALKKDLLETKKTVGSLDDTWVGLWAAVGIEPLVPGEMRVWLQKYNKLMEEGQILRERGADVDNINKLIDKHRSILSDLLVELGETPGDKKERIDGLADRCEALVKAVEDAGQRRKDFLKHIKDLEIRLENVRTDLKEAEKSENEWENKWNKAVNRIGLDGQSLPEEADAVLDRTQQLFERIDEAGVMNGRIKDMENEADEFLKDVTMLCNRLGHDLKDTIPEQAAASLNNRLMTALADAARQEELEKQYKATNLEIIRERNIADDNSILLEDMCRQAGCSSPDDLPGIESRSIAAREKRERIEQLENELAEYSAGSSITELIREAAEVDADSLPFEIEELERQKKEEEERRIKLAESIGREKEILSAMDGGTDASELAERSQAVLAELRGAAERYARLEFAVKVLRKEIEIYREANQGPILQRAGEIFSILTLGSFAGLAPDYDERDNPILTGTRPSGEKVKVEGMSDGTRDQLYLSLRLASLEQHLQNSEPLPLILDDIFINFDDARSKSALKILADLSRKTQIIFFTHHQHLMNLAETNVEKSLLFEHTLTL